MRKIQEIRFETIDEVSNFAEKFGIKQEDIINIEISRQGYNLFFINNSNNNEMQKYLKEKEREYDKEKILVIVIAILVILVVIGVSTYIALFMGK